MADILDLDAELIAAGDQAQADMKAAGFTPVPVWKEEIIIDEDLFETDDDLLTQNLVI